MSLLSTSNSRSQDPITLLACCGYTRIQNPIPRLQQAAKAFHGGLGEAGK